MKSTFSNSQISAILKQVADGASVKKVCSEHDVSHVTIYRWRRKFGNTNAESPPAPETSSAASQTQ